MHHFDKQQAVAKKNSVRLVLVMLIMQLLTIGLIGATFGYLWAVMGQLEFWTHIDEYPFFLNMGLGAAFVAPIAAFCILSAALVKSYELRTGGKKVAEILGATPVEEGDTKNVKKRQLLNVVQELAISAGIPVPPVYVMQGEPGINALAAGHTVQDAVIVVTEGAMRRLTRDQMQGVMAHEFAHILNGDMARNMWLMSFTHGNYVLILIAQEMIDSEPVSMSAAAAQTAILATIAGYVLWPLGLLGAFLALVFTARVKRQDEYHADATAVELTRLPNGLSEALMTIGGNRSRGVVKSGAAFATSHLFFADNGWSFTSIFDSHPPLNDRIARLNPEWDGCYLFESEDEIGHYAEVYEDVVDLVGAAREAVTTADGRKKFVEKKVVPVIATIAATAAMADARHSEEQTQDNDDQEGGAEGESIPDWICQKPDHVVEVNQVYTDLADDPSGAGLILAAIRLDQFEPQRREELASRINPAVRGHLQQLLPNISSLEDEQKIALFDRSLHSISRAPIAVRMLLNEFVQLTHVDPSEETCVARWACQRLVTRRLDPQKKPQSRYGELQPLLLETVILLSSVIHTDSEMNIAAQYTFTRSNSHTGLANVALLAPEDCTIERLEYALDRLTLASARSKRNVLVACGVCATSNRDINLAEAWVIRAVCCGLYFPMPKLVPGQPVLPGA